MTQTSIDRRQKEGQQRTYRRPIMERHFHHRRKKIGAVAVVIIRSNASTATTTLTTTAKTMRRLSLVLCLLLISVSIEAKTLYFEERDNKICPDGQESCPDGATCCQLSNGTYGCCPYQNAVCCSDHEHCCPSGYTCDVPGQRCVQNDGESIEWTKKLKVVPLRKKSNDVPCPDQSHCEDGQTCCELASGGYGCCPYPQAVCCSDQVHCCPNGYTCDVAHGQCRRENGESISWSLKMTTNLIKKSNDVPCPDQSRCEDGQTCCELASGGYGCCPYPQAVCCSDQVHCCPNGYTCDVAHGQCQKGNGDVLAWSPKTKASPIGKISNSIVCPDGSSMCADGQTCCQLASGIWACCPLPQAVCCSDHEHCCPYGTACDLAQQRCVKGNGESTLWLLKTKANQIDDLEIREKAKEEEEQRESIACPDGSSCSAEETCCLTSPTRYGCCPLPRATCCSDYRHCCPNGYSCDIQKQTCIKGNGVEIPWTRKSPSKLRPVETSVCADQKSRCQDGHTCCSRAGTEVHGCCPYENAVCCSDGEHCCPENTVCDVKTQMCQSTKNSMAISWHMLERLIGARAGFGSVKTSVKCPDHKSECPSETTCCQMQSGLYGCCPFKDALCCEDKLHCCPVGFKCDAEHSRCVVEKSGIALPWEMFGRRKAKITP